LGSVRFLNRALNFIKGISALPPQFEALDGPVRELPHLAPHPIAMRLNYVDDEGVAAVGRGAVFRQALYNCCLGEMIIAAR